MFILAGPVELMSCQYLPVLVLEGWTSQPQSRHIFLESSAKLSCVCMFLYCLQLQFFRMECDVLLLPVRWRSGECVF